MQSNDPTKWKRNQYALKATLCKSWTDSFEPLAVWCVRSFVGAKQIPPKKRFHRNHFVLRFTRVFQLFVIAAFFPPPPPPLAYRKVIAFRFTQQLLWSQLTVEWQCINIDRFSKSLVVVVVWKKCSAFELISNWWKRHIQRFNRSTTTTTTKNFLNWCIFQLPPNCNEEIHLFDGWMLRQCFRLQVHGAVAMVHWSVPIQSMQSLFDVQPRNVCARQFVAYWWNVH